MTDVPTQLAYVAARVVLRDCQVEVADRVQTVEEEQAVVCGVCAGALVTPAGEEGERRERGRGQRNGR